MIPLLVCLCVLSALTYAILHVLLHRARTPYSPARNAVSDYGVGPTARLFRISGIANTGTLAFLALALISAGTRWSSWPVLLLALAIVTRVVVAWLPTDLPGEPATWRGRAHLLAAIGQFAAIYAFLADYASSITAGSLWHLPAVALRWLALAGLLGVCLGFVPAARRWFGLLERVFLYSSTLAMVCCALGLLR